MLLAIPLVLCITYKSIQTMVQIIQTKQCHTCTVHALPITNAKILDLHQQAGDI